MAGWLYGSSNPEDLSADQKQTLSAILGAASTTIGASTGNTENAIAAGQAGENAVENNSFTPFVAPVVEVLAPRLIPSLVAGAAGLALAKSIEELEESPEFDQMSGTQKMAAYYTLYLIAKEQGVNKTEILPVDPSINNTGGSEIVEPVSTIITGRPMTDEEIYDYILTTTGATPALPTSTESLPAEQTGLGSVYSENFDPKDFAKSLVNLPPGERVAIVKDKVNQLIPELGLIKDNHLTKLNKRDVYIGKDGALYALDSQHGAFEKVNPKTGKHIDEVNLNLTEKDKTKHDSSGRHDLRIK